MSYSQNDEEMVILRLLEGRGPGRFLDIGAHDGVTFSNTRRLAELGWGGTLVEPSPAAFVELMKNYAGRKDVDLVQVAVTPTGARSTVTLYDSAGDMVSTLSEGHRQLWSGRPGHTRVLGAGVPGKVTFRPIQVSAVSVVDLLADHPGPYEVLNLDVEGTNFEIFRAIPLRDLGVEVACVEYEDKRAAIEGVARAQGYTTAHVTTENLILRRVS